MKFLVTSDSGWDSWLTSDCVMMNDEDVVEFQYSSRDAIRPFLYKKHLTMAKVDIFVDSSKTPLPSPATTDTYFVAGKNLILKGNFSYQVSLIKLLIPILIFVLNDPAKEHDSKFHCRSFKQPSRKVSQVNLVRMQIFWLL